ncbi:MAG TPA: SlyX family protein [Steroidobacteraceae bacterium]
MTGAQFEIEAARLETIEIKLAHLERLLQELGQTVMRQQRDIEVLALRHRELKEQLEFMDEVGADAAGFEKPPQY